jgi:hypothetical protein
LQAAEKKLFMKFVAVICSMKKLPELQAAEKKLFMKFVAVTCSMKKFSDTNCR